MEIVQANSEVPNFVSSIIPRIYRCEAKYLDLAFQTLSFDEYKFLTQSGCVVRLDLEFSEVKDEKNEFVDLEKIMEFLPDVECFR